MTLSMFLWPDAWYGHDDVREVRWIFLGVTVLGAAGWYWWSMQLKQVRLDSGSLKISNFRQEVVVSLTAVERVSGSVLMSLALVWLHLRRPTAFGSKVVFMAPATWFGGFRPHPIGAEPRTSIAKERAR